MSFCKVSVFWFQQRKSLIRVFSVRALRGCKDRLTPLYAMSWTLCGPRLKTQEVHAAEKRRYKKSKRTPPSELQPTRPVCVWGGGAQLGTRHRSPLIVPSDCSRPSSTGFSGLPIRQQTVTVLFP